PSYPSHLHSFPTRRSSDLGPALALHLCDRHAAEYFRGGGGCTAGSCLGTHPGFPADVVAIHVDRQHWPTILWFRLGIADLRNWLYRRVPWHPTSSPTDADFIVSAVDLIQGGIWRRHDQDA